MSEIDNYRSGLRAAEELAGWREADEQRDARECEAEDAQDATLREQASAAVLQDEIERLRRLVHERDEKIIELRISCKMLEHRCRTLERSLAGR